MAAGACGQGVCATQGVLLLLLLVVLLVATQVASWMTTMQHDSTAGMA
jgi:hypothetical protein